MIPENEHVKDNIPVLDKGFVRLVEFMGGDLGVVDAARVSYGGASKGEEADKKLISYLLAHAHLTPFEHAVFKFHVNAPIFVARQWFRHRFAAYNEISYRYTQAKDEFYIPAAWRAQDRKNKQGSIETPSLDHEALTKEFAEEIRRASRLYEEMIAAGVAREMARMILPVNLYTQFYWTVNARSLMNFVSLRADEHAQWEIRQYAQALADIFRRTMPWTYEAFLRHAWRGKNPDLDAQAREALKA